MKLAIMQPYFFPYIGYFQLIKAVDKTILYENVNFKIENWMTRNRIQIKNEQPLYISIPVRSRSSNKKIAEIEIAEHEKWKRRLKRSLQFNYGKSEYFSEVFPQLEKIIDTKKTHLHSYNGETIRLITELLEIGTKIEYNNQHYLELEKKLNQKYQDTLIDESLKKSKRKTERIISISKQEQANIYINAYGGTALYDKNEFAAHGIELFFLKTKDHNYKQFSNNFYPNLSILDVLLNCGIENTQKLLTNYELI